MYYNKNEPLFNDILMSIAIFVLALTIVIVTILKISFAIIDFTIRSITWTINIYNSTRDNRPKRLSIELKPKDK